MNRSTSTISWIIIAFSFALAGTSSAESNNSDLVYFDGTYWHSNTSTYASETNSAAFCSMLPITAEDSSQSYIAHFFQTGRRSNRVNFLFMGDGYTSSEATTYAEQVTAISNEIFSKEPFYSYQNYYNLSLLFTASKDSGVDNDTSYPDDRNTALDMEFWCHETEESLCVDVEKVQQYASNVWDATQIVVLANSTKNSGSAYPFNNIALVSANSQTAGRNLLHQLGHSYANLADESDDHSWTAYTGFEPAEINVSTLNAAEMADNQIKWYRWLGADGGSTYSGLVDTFEGAMGSAQQVYRPTATSAMRDINQAFNLPSAEAIIITTYQYVSPIDNATPADAVLSGSNILFVSPMKPTDHDLDIQWLLNGVAVSGATNSTFRPNDYRLEDGTYTVSVRVVDNTPLVRDEEARRTYLTEEKSWQVNIAQSAPQILEHPQPVVKTRGSVATFSVTARGDGLLYQWYLDNQAILGANTSSLSIPVASMAQNDEHYWVTASNIVGSVTSDRASLRVINRVPSITSIDLQNIARTETDSLPLTITDADGDFISISARVLETESQAVAQIEGTNLKVTAASAYLGRFHVIVSAYDGIDKVESVVIYDVSNRKPTLAAIPNITITHDSVDNTITLIGSDSDGDPLTYTASIIDETSAATLQVNGSRLAITSASTFLGVFHITASVSDGIDTDEKTFQVSVINSKPSLAAIPDQEMSWSEGERQILYVAKDVDGDQLSVIAEIEPYRTFYDLDQQYNFSFNGSWNYDSLSLKEKHLLGTLTSTGKVVSLYILPSGKLYLDGGNVKNSTLVAELPIAYYKDPRLLIDVPEPDTQINVTASIVNNNVVIDPENDYRGTFRVKLTARDAYEYASTSFLVTVYDAVVVIENIAPQIMHWREGSRTIPLKYNDPDVGDVSITITTSPMDNSVAYALDQQENFKLPDTEEMPATLGRGEKFLFGVSTGKIFAILPNGALYRVLDGALENNPITILPPTYYQLPEMLVDVIETINDPIVITTTQNNLTIDPPHRWTGITGFTLTAQSNGSSDSKTVGLFVRNAAPEFVEPEKQAIVYKNGTPSLSPLANDADTEDLPLLSYSAYIGTQENTIKLLNQSYGLQTLTEDTFNRLGWREKYFSGVVDASQVEFFILPNGELYRFQNSIETSPMIGVLDKLYYDNPKALLRQVPQDWQQPDYGDVRTWVDGKVVYFTLPSASIQTASYSILLTDGYNYDFWSFRLSVGGNATPSLEEIQDQRMHWRELDRSITLVGSDREEDPLTYHAELLNSTSAYYLDQANDFYTIGATRPKNVPADNKENKNEKYILGTKNKPGQQFIYVILPTGAIYSYRSSIANSILLAYLSPEYYRNLDLLVDVPPPSFRPISLSVVDSKLTITQIEQGWRGSVIVRAYVSDGFSSSSRNFILTIFNDAPVLPEVKSVEVHHSKDSYSIQLRATDVNNEPLSYQAKIETYLHRAYTLDQEYNFSVTSSIYYFNREGWREKILAGTVQGASAEFALLESGELYLWNGKISESTLIAYLPTSYYANPKLLVNVQAATPPPDANVSIENGVITVTFADGFEGDVPVIVEASDGNLYDNKTFLVSRMNHAPTIANFNDLKIHWRTDLVTLTPTISDADKDSLEISARLKDGNGFAPADISVLNGSIVINPINRWTGSFSVEAEVSDSKKTTSKDSVVTVYNNPPVLTNIPKIAMSRNQDNVTVKLAAQDSDYIDVPKLSYSAFLGTEAHIAHALSSKYGFNIDSQNLNYNKLGWSEKHFQGTLNLEESSYAILPNGEIFVITNNNQFGDFIGQVALRYYKNPLLLTEQTDLSTLPNVNVTVNNNILLIDPPSAYLGTFPVTVVVSDGLNYDSQEVSVSVSNSSPVISNITAKAMPWNIGVLNVPLTITDADGDSLSITSEVISDNESPLSVEVISGALLIHLDRLWLGTAQIKVSASDGLSSVSKTFPVSVANSAPQLAAIPDRTVHWTLDKVNIPLNVKDADSNPITLSAKLTSGSVAGAIQLQDSSLMIDLPTQELGTSVIEVMATDGNLSTSRSFKLNVSNTTPVITRIVDQLVKSLKNNLVVPIRAYDPDEDPLTYEATSDTEGVNVSIDQQKLNIAANADLTEFSVTVKASDKFSSVSQTFKVKVVNTAPTIKAIPNQTVHWTESEVRVPFTVSDEEENPISTSASIISGDVAGETRVEDGTIVVTLPNHKIGSSRIELTATDGLLSSAKSFNISVTNKDPVISPSSPQSMPVGETALDFELNASDPDGDNLSYEVSIIDPARMAYELDKQHNFELVGGDYFYDMLGNGEKYIQGTKNEPEGLYTYVIYPNGDFYEWREKLSKSVYLGRLAVQYYQTPSLLFDMIEPSAETAPATVQVNSSTSESVSLKVRPVSGFIGQFLVQVKASDSIAEDVENVVIEVFNPEEDGDVSAPIDECKTEASLYSGEFTNSTFVSSFTAEGRIGDSATGPGARTFELDVSRSTSGPFAKGETTNYIWPSEQVVEFKLEFDAKKKEATLTLDKKTTVTHNATVNLPITDLLIRARAVSSTNSISLSDLSLNGESLGTGVSASNTAGGVNVLQVTSGTINGDFVLEGKVTMTYVANNGVMPKNSELAFQISAVNIEGHRSSCDGTAERKVTICHIPPGNPENAHTITVGASALPAHLDHGDVIGECPGTPTDRSDTCDSGPALQSPTYVQWNTILGMTNTLELSNRGDTALSVNADVLSYQGTVVGNKLLSIDPHTQISIPVESLPGYKRNSQGLIKLVYNGLLDGRMVYKRTKSKKEEFAFVIPLADGLYGDTSVGFNTTQPSSVESESKNRVINWLSITNLDSVLQKFDVSTYSDKGKLLLRRTIKVYPFTRMNIDGGHDLAGPNKYGFHLISPVVPTTEYLAELTRFGGDNKTGLAASTYKFALNFPAQLAQSDRLYLPFTRKAGETSLIEVSNLLKTTTKVGVNFFNSKGKLVESIRTAVSAHGQVVLDAVKYLDVGDFGYAQVIPYKDRSIAADSVVYYLSDSSSGSVTSAYSANGRRDSLCLLTGAYSLVDDLENWLLIANPSNTNTKALITLESGSTSAERSVVLRARASTLIPIHDPAQLKAPAGSSGLLYVRSSTTPTTLFAQLLRVRKSGKYIDDTALTPMR